MKSLKSVILVIMFSAMLTTLLALDNITGGFGLNFGDSIEQNKVIGQSETNSGKPLYKVNPPLPYRIFSDYYVMITPKTRKIHSVWATSNFQNNAKCIAELDVLKGLLEQKYGVFEQTLFSMNRSYSLRTGTRSIIIKCDDNFSSATMYAMYDDSEIANLANQEYIEIEKQNNDTRGL